MTQVWRNRITGATVMLLAVGLVAACGFAPSSSEESGSTDLSRYYDQSITWSACDGEYQCGSFEVPLNYADPGGEAITIQVLKSPAKDPTKRLGSLVVNPGGPGASGIEFAQYAGGTVSAAVLAQYDIVGFDPRGVVKSTPIECLDGPQTDQLLATLGAPANASQREQVEQVARGLGESCRENSPQLTPAIGTVAAARDMDVLRDLLDEPKLNYLGLSYGTLLGLIYIEQFNNTVGRFVLDGVIDPSLSNAGVARGQAEGFQLALSRFIEDCPKHNDCPLPAGQAAAVDTINSWLAKIAVDPIRAAPERPLTRPLATNGIIASLYSETDGWPQLRRALAAGFRNNGMPLLEIVDSFTGRQEDGSYRDNAVDALYAVSCLDRPDRADANTTAEYANDWSSTAPTFGPELAWGNLPCSTWPAPATFEPHAITSPTQDPVLLVGTRYDPATPFVWAQAVAGQLPNNRLLTYEDDGHTGYGDNPCVNKAIDTLFLTGEPPTPNLTCR